MVSPLTSKHTSQSPALARVGRTVQYAVRPSAWVNTHVVVVDGALGTFSQAYRAARRRGLGIEAGF